MKTELSDRFIGRLKSIASEFPEDKFLVAVSGGADSTALLYAAVRAGVPCVAAHCNFNLRGDESIRDKEFVINLCENLGVTLHLTEFNTESLKRPGESIEMTCRRLRYNFFDQICRTQGMTKVLVAHNADDNIETFFLNALRGSGSRGLRGMEEFSDKIIRPLLTFSRNEILDFLYENRQPYIVDSSNLKSDFRRNYLRNIILPLLETKWEGYRSAMSTTIHLQQKENKIIEHFVAKALEGLSTLLPWDRINEFPDPETLIYRFMAPLGGSPTIAGEITAGAANPQPGKKWQLSKNTLAVFTRDGILIEKIEEKLEDLSVEFLWEQVDVKAVGFQTIANAKLTEAYFPLDKDRIDCVFATPEMKIKSLGMKGSQRVWKVLKDAGLTLLQRSRFPVIVEKATGEPLWLPGIKRSRLHLVSPSSPTAFRLTRCR